MVATDDAVAGAAVVGPPNAAAAMHELVVAAAVAGPPTAAVAAAMHELVVAETAAPIAVTVSDATATWSRACPKKQGSQSRARLPPGYVVAMLCLG